MICQPNLSLIQLLIFRYFANRHRLMHNLLPTLLVELTTPSRQKSGRFAHWFFYMIHSSIYMCELSHGWCSSSTPKRKKLLLHCWISLRDHGRHSEQPQDFLFTGKSDFLFYPERLSTSQIEWVWSCCTQLLSLYVFGKWCGTVTEREWKLPLWKLAP